VTFTAKRQHDHTFCIIGATVANRIGCDPATRVDGRGNVASALVSDGLNWVSVPDLDLATGARRDTTAL
jgi:hypothetical protein